MERLLGKMLEMILGFLIQDICFIYLILLDLVIFLFRFFVLVYDQIIALLLFLYSGLVISLLWNEEDLKMLLYPSKC